MSDDEPICHLARAAGPPDRRLPCTRRQSPFFDPFSRCSVRTPIPAWPYVLSSRSSTISQLLQQETRSDGDSPSWKGQVVYRESAGVLPVMPITRQSWDEYAYLVRNVLQREKAQRVLRASGQRDGHVDGTARSQQPNGYGTDIASTNAVACPLRIVFRGRRCPERRRERERLANRSYREAFNSPFWPFVLATTSTGQEGLDFHLYCRDIVHWNLPSNPVDLEQREGRINRYDGLSIRPRTTRAGSLSCLD